MAKTEKNDGKVLVDVADMQALSARIAELESARGTTAVADLDAPTERTCRVKLHDGRPVSKVSKVRSTGVRNGEGAEVMTCVLTVVGKDGKTADVEADYLQFVREAEQATATIVSSEPVKRDYVPALSPERIEVTTINGYSATGTGQYVKNVVRMNDYLHTVRMPDGEEVVLETINL